MDINWNLKFIKEKCYSLDNDRFKKKSFVYAPFPEIDKHGFQDGEIREIILSGKKTFTKDLQPEKA